MEGVTFTVNYGELLHTIERVVGENAQVASQVDTLVKTLFKRCKDAMLRDFNNHKITKELQAGPDSENISQTLNGADGNLYSFLGFYFGSDPTQELRSLLESETLIRRSTRSGTTFYYRVYYPDKNDIELASRMDWGSGTSWAFAVENGEFNGDAHLSHYIYKTWLGGRSGGGVQVQGVYSENDFNPQPYITEILHNFVARINEFGV